MGKAIDLTKQEFERLTAIRPTEKRAADGSIIWECLCFCGKMHPASSSHLRSGHTKSCGCLKVDSMSMLFKTHGMSESLIYLIWRAMLSRCENPENKSYKNYGGRGTKVCERWHTFENFYADVGDRPEGMTLDRWPDNDGDYKPTNFRWATWEEQAGNRRPKTTRH